MLWIDKDGVKPAWLDVIKKHSDRVMLGTDPCCRIETRYSEMINDMRTIFLPYFEPEVVKKLLTKMQYDYLNWMDQNNKFISLPR